MIINWYTVIFQMINFLLLVFLLKRFLYGPVIEMMAEREQNILAREEEAKATRLEAAAAKEALSLEKERLKESQNTLLEETRKSAEEEKVKLQKEARQEVQEVRGRWAAALKKEQEAFAKELRIRLGRQASELARRCLEELADARLEELVLENFLLNLKALSEEDKHNFAAGMKSAQGQVHLYSAFTLKDEQKEMVAQALTEALGLGPAEPQLLWKKQKELICGLELESGGFRLSWNIEQYVQVMEKEILKNLNEADPFLERAREEQAFEQENQI